MGMTILRDLSVLWSLLHILVLFMLLYRSRYPKRRTVILTVVFMGSLVLLNVAGLVRYGTEYMGRVFLLTCTLPSLLFFWFMSQDKRGRFFFTFCVADTVSYWIIALTNIMDFYLGGQGYILMFVGRLVLFPLVEWVAYRYLRKPYRELQESVAKGWGLFAGNSEFSRGCHKKAAGASGVPAHYGADAHDICHNFCGDVPPASALSAAGERADAAGAEECA